MIEIHAVSQIERLRRAGRVAAATLATIGTRLVAGVVVACFDGVAWEHPASTPVILATVLRSVCDGAE